MEHFKRLNSVFLEVSFPIDKISGLQFVILKVFVSWECVVRKIVLLKHDYSQQKQLGLYNVEIIFPFINCMSKGVGARCIRHLVTISKDDNL